MKKFFVSFAAFLVLTSALVNAQKKEEHGHDHFNGPPHGGTPVQVGSHAYHLELVRDASAGKIQAFVLDGHMEHYRKVSEKSFELVAKIGTNQHRIEFQRAPEPGQTKVADASSMFEAKADWIKTASKFDGVIPTITLGGKTFTNIVFSFPKGTAHAH
jgi:hypothetical protein